MLLTMLKKQEQVETWFLISKFITDQSLVLKKTLGIDDAGY